MKRTFFFLLLICCSFASVASASDFNEFFVLDQIKDSVEIYDGQQRIATLKSTPKPARIIKNPNNSGYILMNRGAKKNPGRLTFLNPDFNSASRKELTGLVVQDFYLKETGLWLLFTVTSDKNDPVSNLTCYNTKTEATTTISLSGPPVTYRFNADQTELAVGTLGNAKNKVPAELALIDLIQNQVRRFPVSANPGTIYQTASGKIVVACGGFRNSQRYPSKALIEKTNTAEFAKLHWIDTDTGETEVTQLGYSPLLIGQDQNDSDTFYAVCVNVYGDPNQAQQGITLGSVINSDTNRPEATFYKISSGKITADLKLQNQPKSMVQPSSGIVCLQGEKELLIIDLSGPAPQLMKYTNDRNIDEFLYNNDGTTGFLSNVNSNFLNIIDLRTGKEIKTLQISKTFYIGKMFIDLFKSGSLPVIQATPAKPETMNSSENRRMCFSKDFSHLYILAGAPEVSIIDLQTNEVKSLINFSGSPYGIHFTPDGKYIAVATENGWHLLDPSQRKPVLSLKLIPEEYEQGPENGYYSPNGNLLIIPFKNNLHLIDPIQGISLGKVRTKAIAPLIVWPE